MKRLTFVLSGVLFLLYFFSYRGVLSHVIFYHEQHHLFLYSQEYFHQCIQAEGWLCYLANFVIQFFYMPALGCAILAFMIASVHLLSYQIIKFITGKEDWMQLSVLPSLALFFYTMSPEHSLSLVIGCFLALSVLDVLLKIAFRCRRKAQAASGHTLLAKPYLRVSLLCFFLILYAGGGYYYFIRTYNRSERIMLMAEQAVKAKDWEKVLDCAERYFQTGRSNQLFSYFYNLALFHTGGLPYHLFDYPKRLGVKELYFPWNSDSRESEYGHFLYEDLGYINEAQRWEFEAMVVWGETAPHLLNLARYNIANHRPLVAQRFINKLKQSLFYRKEALRLEQIIRTGQVDGMRNALPDVKDTPARFANVINIGPELEYICEHDSTNRMAFEYLMSDLLLSNNVVRFAKNLKRIRNFHYDGLPPCYEEALYIYKLGVSEEEFGQVGFPVSKETERRFRRYYQLMKNKEMNVLQAEFGKTYWFYMNYISPYGNKVISR